LTLAGVRAADQAIRSQVGAAIACASAADGLRAIAASIARDI